MTRAPDGAGAEGVAEAEAGMSPEDAAGGWPRVALLSLADKRGAPEFARALVARGARIVASGGTAAHLAGAGVEATPLEQWSRMRGRARRAWPR